MKLIDHKSFDRSHKICIITNDNNKDSYQTHRSQYGHCINIEYDLSIKMCTTKLITHTSNRVTKKV